MNRRHFGGLSAAALFGAGLDAASQPQNVPQTAPQYTANTIKRDRLNVLLLMADQWRADCMGAYGNKAISTLNLDHQERKSRAQGLGNSTTTSISTGTT